MVISTVLISAPVQASHYRLSSIPAVISAKHVKVLRKAGIVTTADLFNRSYTRRLRAHLRKRTGISATTLYRWARFADVLRVPGLGPTMVKLLRAAGIGRLRHLRYARPGPLHQKMRAENARKRISHAMPELETVTEWINQAKKLKDLLR